MIIKLQLFSKSELLKNVIDPTNELFKPIYVILNIYIEL